MDRADERRRFTLSGSIRAIALAILFSLAASCFLYAIHVRSEAGVKDRPAGREKTGRLGEVDRGPRGKKEIALTFDAGAEAECFDDLIRALANAHASSTFFITGRFVHDHSDCADEITKHGHEVGNHTWSHLDLTQQPDDVVRDEIMRAEHTIVQASGQSPRPRWRAPYGARDKRVLKIAANLGYRSIYWTLDSQDGVEPVKTPQFLIDRITNKSDEELDGAIILNARRGSQHRGCFARDHHEFTRPRFPSRHNFEAFGICAEATLKIADRKCADKDAKPMQGIA
jgi:peptidoglycan/xylan/chitin deacetylase (PgdA/CDA1 family)